MDLDLFQCNRAIVQKCKQRATVSGERKVKGYNLIFSLVPRVSPSSPSLGGGTSWYMCNIKSRHEVDTHAPVHIFRNSQDKDMQVLTQVATITQTPFARKLLQQP